MHKSALLSVAAVLAISMPGLAETRNPSLVKGIQLFNAGQAQQALPWLLQAAKTGAGKGSDVHYYLGNVYMKLGRKETAIEEYKLSVGLDPASKAAALSKKNLEQLEPHATSAGTDNSRGADRAIADAVNKLPFPTMPPLPTASDEHPTLYEIQKWTPELRSQYMTQAQDRVPRAQKQLYDAQQLLRKAQDAASAFNAGKRKPGEDDATYKVRLRAYQKRVNAALQPFQDYVKSSDQQLKDSKNIFDTCQLAFRNINGYMPTSR
jgi:tetratricopeptide (TPR) repeat protein